MAVIAVFTPMVELVVAPVAPDLSGSEPFSTPPTTISFSPVVRVNGSPVTADSLEIVDDPANGDAEVVGLTLQYTPNDGFRGADSFTYLAIVSGIESNVATASVAVTEAPCKELGRTTRTYVTGYSLSRVNVTRVRRMAKRCVVANFNGAIPKERSIVSVRWETTSPWAILMSNARIATGGRETMVDVTFNFSGWGGLLATVALDNGEVYNAEFSFTVLDTPLYPTATYPVSNGPYILTASI